MVIYIIAIVVVLVASLGIVAHFLEPPEKRAAREAEAARWCTKHVIVSSMIMGGPDHMSWVYGPHRTEGNACDGPEHQRRSGWQ